MYLVYHPVNVNTRVLFWFCLNQKWDFIRIFCTRKTKEKDRIYIYKNTWFGFFQAVSYSLESVAAPHTTQGFKWTPWLCFAGTTPSLSLFKVSFWQYIYNILSIEHISFIQKFRSNWEKRETEESFFIYVASPFVSLKTDWERASNRIS